MGRPLLRVLCRDVTKAENVKVGIPPKRAKNRMLPFKSLVTNDVTDHEILLPIVLPFKWLQISSVTDVTDFK
jgi:hypothetical protein